MQQAFSIRFLDSFSYLQSRHEQGKFTKLQTSFRVVGRNAGLLQKAVFLWVRENRELSLRVTELSLKHRMHKQSSTFPDFRVVLGFLGQYLSYSPNVSHTPEIAVSRVLAAIRGYLRLSSCFCRLEAQDVHSEPQGRS